MEDGGQPPAHVVHAGRVPHAVGRLVLAGIVAGAVVGLRARRHCRAPDAPTAGRRVAARAGDLQAEPRARRRPRFSLGVRPAGADAHDHGAPGGVDGRCHRPDAGPSVRDASAPVGVANDGTRGPTYSADAHRVLSPDGRRCLARASGRRGVAVAKPWRSSGSVAGPAPVGVRSRHRARGEPPRHGGTHGAIVRGRAAHAATDRPAHLGVFHDVRERGKPRPAAGQLPGDTVAGGRAAHVADQHRVVPARGADSARLRLGGDPRRDRQARSDAAHPEGARSSSRPSL